MSVFEGPRGKPVLKGSCRLPEFPIDPAELERRLVRPPASYNDPLRQVKENIPAEKFKPGYTAVRGIAPGTPTTHGSESFSDFWVYKYWEERKEIPKDQAEYFRYGTPVTRQLEEALARGHGGESAVTFISEGAAKNAMIESLLPVSTEISHFVVSSGIDSATRELLERLARRGRADVTMVSREEVSRLGAFLKPNTRAVILENVLDPALGVVSVSGAKESIAASGSRAVLVVDQTASSASDVKLFADGADLVLPALGIFHSDGTGRVTGAVVGHERLLAPIRDHRGQHGTISHDLDCRGVEQGLVTRGLQQGGARERDAEIPRRIARSSQSLSGTRITERTEKALGELDGGEAYAFRSGMAAISAVIDTILPEDGSVAHIIVPEQGYRQTWNILDRLQKQGRVELTVVPMDGFGDIQRLIKHNTAAVFFETPSNPYLRVIDVQDVRNQVDQAASKALVIVDHTFSSPLNQRPLSQGAHLVVPSLTKYVSGSNQVGAGAVVGHGELIKRVRDIRTLHGSIAHDVDCLGVDEGIRTLEERIPLHNRNGFHVAELLAEHPLVRKLWYPGHPSHPDYAVAKKQMTGFGGVVSFRLAADDFFEVAAFLDAAIAASPKGTFIGPSFGGDYPLYSSVALVSHFQQSPDERAARGITDDLIRLSVGTLSKESLTRALEAGFGALAAHKGLI